MSDFQEAKTSLFIECPKAFIKLVPDQDEEQGSFFQAEDGYGIFWDQAIPKLMHGNLPFIT